MLGYIPSPSSNGISIGPLRLHMYGFLIVAGVFAAVWLADRRWRARGGEPGTFSAIALWAVPGGLIGARLYHVATDYQLYTDRPLDAFKIWQGGLGIWGGIAGGALAAWLYVRRHNMDFAAIMDTVAPALPLAQAIGRWGNYFNQELFGRPTRLPWGLKIDVANRLSYTGYSTFHPTFLYESLWDLAVVGLVLWAEKHVRLRKGYLFAVYVALYTFGRFFTEYLRIDKAHRILGLRINDWTSVIVFLAATTILLRKGLIRRRGAPGEPSAGETAAAEDQADAGEAYAGEAYAGEAYAGEAAAGEAAAFGVDDPEGDDPDRDGPERPRVAVAAGQRSMAASPAGDTGDQHPSGPATIADAALSTPEEDVSSPAQATEPEPAVTAPVVEGGTKSETADFESPGSAPNRPDAAESGVAEPASPASPASPAEPASPATEAKAAGIDHAPDAEGGRSEQPPDL